MEVNYAALAIIKDEKGRIIFNQEPEQRRLGLWVLPGGRLNENEKRMQGFDGYREAARREVREEFGYEIKLTSDPIGPYDDVYNYKPIKIVFFKGELSKKVGVGETDTIEVEPNRINEIPTLDSIKQVLKDLDTQKN
jgi:8-oxo-dGTP pyrophosphatase MutT (NUDIX family)